VQKARRSNFGQRHVHGGRGFAVALVWGGGCVCLDQYLGGTLVSWQNSPYHTTSATRQQKTRSKQSNHKVAPFVERDDDKIFLTPGEFLFNSWRIGIF